MLEKIIFQVFGILAVMDIRKISPWIGGILSIVSGSLLVYFETYRNNQTIDIIAYGLIFFGWIALFIKATKGTSIDAKKIFFKDDQAGWFQQRASNLIYYFLFFAVLIGNIYYITTMAHERKQQILANGPTKTTVAEVGYIDIRHGRNTTSYYAVFQYTVDGKIITHPWHEENENDFSAGDKYVIKYSVEYPEMFVLQQKIQ
jgi:hypothetical protein